MTSPLHTAPPSLTPEMIAAPLPLMDPSVQVPPGLYRHYKGRFYQVLGTARHSESLEPMTVYRALYGEHGLWVRPAAMFAEEITIDGVPCQRFQRVQDATPAPEQSAQADEAGGLDGVNVQGRSGAPDSNNYE